MNRILLALATASIFAMGCGRAALDQGAAAPAPSPAKVETAASKAPETTLASAETKSDVADAAPAAGARMPGDFVVYRFSGSFRKTPLTLTQRVIARKGQELTIDFLAVEGSDREELRVTLDETSHEVKSVKLLDHGVEKATDLDAYGSLMARTALAADQNEALLGTEEVSVDVGGASVSAKKTTYRVRVGKRQATMHTLESTSFAWGDVGGEITTDKGKVLYRAEVVEAGHDDAAAHAAAMNQ
jgi:hypothetical protein